MKRVYTQKITLFAFKDILQWRCFITKSTGDTKDNYSDFAAEYPVVKNGDL
jgi:hypothetical protein